MSGVRRQRGDVTVPSGILVVADMGYLIDWSAEREPDPPARYGEDVPTHVRDARDYVIRGEDALEAARELDPQSLSFFYDVSGDEEGDRLLRESSRRPSLRAG